MKEYKNLGKLSFKTRFLRFILRTHKKFKKQKPFNLIKSRLARVKNMSRACGKPCKGVKIENLNWCGYPAQFYTPDKIVDDSYTILYLHGGAYIGSSVEIYSGFVTRFSRELGFKAYSFDYPLAPEAPYPCALNAVLEFYNEMIKHGVNPEKIIMAGDSAGAGLVLSVSKKLQENGGKLPGMFCLFSPWVDLSNSGESVNYNVKNDLMITQQLLEKASALYCGENNRRDPLISPLFNSFDGFPPVYLLVADDELLYSDSEKLHDNLAACGVDVYLSIWKGMQHAFVVGARLFPESKIVLRDIKEFIYARCGITDKK